VQVVLQRVRSAQCLVDKEVVGEIHRGLVIFVGVEENDREETMKTASEKILGLRMFDDDEDRMNLNLIDVEGDLLVIPNFTLCSDGSSGRRPSFGSAAPPDRAERLYERLLDHFRERTDGVQSGRFGAHMEVTVENDGPVTLVRSYK
jgi:D-tyrosyl-tRNA(Tyr) deacylase